MKNRYFGDIHDYVKYSLIRCITQIESVSPVVCWMLTDDDESKDGRRIKYLEEPEKWRSYDPILYDYLHHHVIQRGTRNVNVIETSGIIPECRFYSKLLLDDPEDRQLFFKHFLEKTQDPSFVFFDPDNGIEVKSIKYGKKKSSKYLYLMEIQEMLDANHSLLIYQHFPYQPRIPFIEKITSKLLSYSKSEVVYSIRNGQIVFFLLPQIDILPMIRTAMVDLQKTWDGILIVQEHSVDI